MHKGTFYILGFGCALSVRNMDKEIVVLHDSLKAWKIIMDKHLECLGACVNLFCSGNKVENFRGQC